MSFIKQFRKEREAHINAVRESHRIAAIEAGNYIVNFAVVGNTDLWKTKYPPKDYVGGAFRGSFVLSKDKASSKVFDEIRSESEIKSDYSRISREYANSWFFTSNLPYSKRLDNGWSKQNPNGLTAPCALHVNSMLPAIIRNANQKYGIS